MKDDDFYLLAKETVLVCINKIREAACEEPITENYLSVIDITRDLESGYYYATIALRTDMSKRYLVCYSSDTGEIVVREYTQTNEMLFTQDDTMSLLLYS